MSLQSFPNNKLSNNIEPGYPNVPDLLDSYKYTEENINKLA